MSSRSAELIAYRDRMLSKPRHLWEFEQECSMRSINERIDAALRYDAYANALIAETALRSRMLDALLAVGDFRQTRGTDGSHKLLSAVAEMYLTRVEKK